MRAYVSLIDDALADILERVEQVTVPVTNANVDQISPGCAAHSRQAYYQLAMVCRGPAVGIVKAVERGNGVEAWRRLYRRYEPDAGPRLQNMMTRILNPGVFPEDTAGFEAALVAWES